MDFKISVSEENKYLIIKVNVPMTAELGGRCGIEATALGKKTGISRYLFDLRGFPNVDGATTSYEYVNRDMYLLGLPKNERTALLTDSEDRSHDFIAHLMNNAGYNIKVFDSEQASIDWLSG